MRAEIQELKKQAQKNGIFIKEVCVEEELFKKFLFDPIVWETIKAQMMNSMQGNPFIEGFMYDGVKISIKEDE